MEREDIDEIQLYANRERLSMKIKHDQDGVRIFLKAKRNEEMTEMKAKRISAKLRAMGHDASWKYMADGTVVMVFG